MVVRQHSICNNSFVMFPTAADSVFAVNILPSSTDHTINLRAQQREQPRLPTRFTRQLNFYCQMLLCKHHYIDFDTDVNNHAALKASRRSPEDRKISHILSSSVFVSRILLFIDYWHTPECLVNTVAGVCSRNWRLQTLV